jgi:hypothetical protein
MRNLALVSVILVTGCTTADLVAPRMTPQQQAAALQLSGQLMAPPPPVAPPPVSRCYTTPLNGSYVTRCYAPTAAVGSRPLPRRNWKNSAMFRHLSRYRGHGTI